MSARLFLSIGSTVAAATLLLTVVALLPGCDNATARVEAVSTSPAKPAALPTDEQLKSHLDAVIDDARRRYMDPKVNHAWQIVHGVLAYGYDLELNVDGKLVPAVEWILNGGTFEGWVLLPTNKGLESPVAGDKKGAGHEDQWIGYFSQIGVPLDNPLIVGNSTHKVRELFTQAEWDTRDPMEATWTLMGLATYMPSNHSWTARDGSSWNIDRLTALETPAKLEDLRGAACGGSHRLYGLVVSVNRRLREGGELTGGWLLAKTMIDQAIQAARQYQQPDGSFSTEYFQRSSRAQDIAVRLNTTGHTFEFLALALPDHELAAPWMVRACDALLAMFDRTKNLDLECGGLYHAAHGLRIYRARRFGEDPKMHPVLNGITAK